MKKNQLSIVAACARRSREIFSVWKPGRRLVAGCVGLALAGQMQGADDAAVPALEQELNVPQPQYVVQNWGGNWITSADISGNEPVQVLFRRVFTLPEKPARFVVNITADNHYTLYVNGARVGFGPQLSDLRHWRYETVDLARHLQAGTNTVAVEVVNWGPDRFFGIQSHRTGLLLNGYTEGAAVLSTAKSNVWKCLVNPALTFQPVCWRTSPAEIVGGFYAGNPTDRFNAATYPWGWQETGFDDSGWPRAVFLEGAPTVGSSHGWITEPRNTPMQAQQVERVARVTRARGVTVPEGFPAGREPLVVPPRTVATVLLDNAQMTIGYPELVFSGGQGATVRMTYAENLFAPDKSKGNRNETAGKEIIGYSDVIRPDGGSRRRFRTSWLRAYRFVQLEITTAAAPVTIEDFHNLLTTSPLDRKAFFRSDNPRHEEVFDLCWRTARLCTQDNFLSDAYYETMQYVGDTKVHAMVWQALTGDDRHWRNALLQFNNSRLPDGNLTSCAPLRATFVHPTYSLIWVDMLYDHLLYHGDRDFIRPFLPGIRFTLDSMAQTLDAAGLPGKTRWFPFVDWYAESKRGGMAPGSEDGGSAVVALHYVFTLQNAARICDCLGEPEEAARYRRQAEHTRRQVVALFYDPADGSFRENAGGFRSQHVNIMAVLTDAVPLAQQPKLLEKILADPGFSQASYYYRFYLFDALRKTHAGGLFDAVHQPWDELTSLGLTTTPERLGSPQKPPRSECHPWSTAPAWAYFAVIAGIEPAAIGFNEVRMQPDLGKLSFIEGRYPHPRGDIEFQLKRTPGNGLTGQVTLPAGLTGNFFWEGKSLRLVSGKQAINL